MALDHSCQIQRATLAERGLDLYETPPVAVEALLRYEKLPHQIWEPAAGRGAIVRVLRNAGHAVIASDVHDYGFPLHFVRDFLTETAMPTGCELILTNPPFNIIAKFVVARSRTSPEGDRAPRLAFLEAGELGSKQLDRHLRSLVLDGGRLARIYNFRKRLPMMHRDTWAGKKSNSGMAFAWFCFDREHEGPPTIRRISWDRPAMGEPELSPATEGITAMVNPKPNIDTPEPDADRSDPVKTVEPGAAPTPIDYKEQESAIAAAIGKGPDDPFDLSKLRLTQEFRETSGVKKLLTSVLVRKPSPQDFVRVHPGPDYRETLAVIELKDDREMYLLPPSIAQELPGEFIMVSLFTAINRQNVVFLWPVRLPASDGKELEWHRTAAVAAELAMKRWVRVKANMSAGCYDIYEASSTIPDPRWPEHTFTELMRLGFRDRLVTNFDHPVIKRLRGLS
jgi:hypothetical protein